MKQSLRERLESHLETLKNNIVVSSKIIEDSIKDCNYQLAADYQTRISVWTNEIESLNNLLR